MNGKTPSPNAPDVDGDADTKLEYGDSDLTILESQYDSPVKIKRLEGAPVVTVNIIYQPRSTPAPLNEMIAFAMYELNKLNLPPDQTINIIKEGDGEIPFGVVGAIILQLQAKYRAIAVWCPQSSSFESIIF